MAEIKVPHPEVVAAAKSVSGCMAEAYSLVELMEQTQDESPFVTLAHSIIERLCNAVATHEHQLLRHGVPSLDERPPLE